MQSKRWISLISSAVAGALVTWLVLTLSSPNGTGANLNQPPSPDPSQSVGAQTGNDQKKFDTSKSPADALPDQSIPPAEQGLPEGSLDSVSDPTFPAARTNLELTLFRASSISCEKLTKSGVKFYYADGSYELISSDRDGLAHGNLFAGDGSWISQSHFDDREPIICDPDSINTQVLRGNRNLAVNFLIESSDGISFIWHSHHGGSDLSTTTFTVANDLITQVQEANYSILFIRYGLSKAERASALDTY